MSADDSLCNRSRKATLDPTRYAHGARPRGPVSPSRMGGRRALVLLGIHLLALAHILHWRHAGETISPVEPSEAMYTLRDGVVNAGAVLMAVASLSVLLVGRFFCGWACHLVAIQDACAWLLRRIGITPRPLRSRLLVLVPFGVALVMFGMPLVHRYRNDLGLPEFTAGFTKTDFWETFPGLWMTLITFGVCGVVMVYLLGAKGFCTYGCPYGGVFAALERFSPGRIRVSDACKSCGHCTAVCTSNVQVAAEVHRHGMVVDPGCMKCLDCVSTCPEGALSFGFGAPAAPSSGTPPRRRSSGFPLGTELVMAVTFGLTLTALAGLPETFAPWATSLHGSMPLLLAVSLAVITAFIAGFLIEKTRGAAVDMTGARLAQSGSWSRPGRLFVVLAVAWLAFVGHAAIVQGFTFAGNVNFERIDVARWAWREADVVVPDDVMARVRTARSCYERASGLSWYGDPRYPARLAGLAVVERDLDSAVAAIERAIRLRPDHADFHAELARIRSVGGRPAAAIEAVEAAIERDPANLTYWREKLSYAMAANDLRRGVEAMEVLVDHVRGDARRQTLMSIAGIHLETGAPERAKEALETLLSEWPEDAEGRRMMAISRRRMRDDR